MKLPKNIKALTEVEEGARAFYKQNAAGTFDCLIEITQDPAATTTTVPATTVSAATAVPTTTTASPDAQLLKALREQIEKQDARLKSMEQENRVIKLQRPIEKLLIEAGCEDVDYLVNQALTQFDLDEKGGHVQKAGANLLLSLKDKTKPMDIVEWAKEYMPSQRPRLFKATNGTGTTNTTTTAVNPAAKGAVDWKALETLALTNPAEAVRVAKEAGIAIA